MTRNKKVVMAIVLVLVMALGVVFPVGLRQVKAATNHTIKFDGRVEGNSPNQTVTYNVGGTDVVATVTENIDMTNDNKTATISVGDDNVFSGITIGDTFDSNTMDIKLVGSNSFNTNLTWSDGKLTKDNNVNLPNETLTFSIEAKGQVVEDDPSGESQPVYNPTGDDVYFVWFDGSSVYSHRIVNVVGDNSINYVPLATVTDDATGAAYSLSNDQYEFCWKAVKNGDTETALETYMSSQEFKDAENKRDALREAGFSIDPCISKDEAMGGSTIVTNGNRQFRIIIYNADTFEGIQFSQNEDDYSYFPSYWDSTFATGFLDISGTTPENPAEYNTFILEPTIKFNMADNSNSPITRLEALDVPSGAVTITGNGVQGYNIQFGSHFFDNVVFRATSANGTYYIKINRAAINMGPSEGSNVVANLYYDNSESHTDYDVYATVTYNDGTRSLQKLDPVPVTTQGGDKTGQLEIEGGKGLKESSYSVSASQGTALNVKFNVVKAGTLTAGTYGGTYAGSNDGTTYVLQSHKTIY